MRTKGHVLRSLGAHLLRRPAKGEAGFTLVEVLAALMLIAIIVPVAMQAVSIASRSGTLGQRKAAAMRVADRLLNEFIISGETQQASTTGTVSEGEMTYPWTFLSENWTEDAMTLLTVRVEFTVQGETYTASASTLIDPAASSGAITTAGTQ